MTSAIIFPTTSRTKHAKQVAYPIGAEILSQALSTAPQAPLLTCAFIAGGYNQIHKPRDTHLVMWIGYSKRSRTFNDSANAGERGVFDAKWEIAVYAVPIRLRHTVKTELINHVLPKTVLPWLIANQGLGAASGSQGLRIDYDELNTRMEVDPRGVLAALTHR